MKKIILVLLGIMTVISLVLAFKGVFKDFIWIITGILIGVTAVCIIKELIKKKLKK